MGCVLYAAIRFLALAPRAVYRARIISSAGELIMAKLNLKKLSFNELVVLRVRVQAELSRKIGAERGSLEKRIADLAKLESGGSVRPNKSAGTTKAQRTPVGAVRKPNASSAKKVAPKYRGPDGETWSGRGLAPKWLKSLEADGKKRESYLIRK